jgi:hypothetical protein
MKIASLLVPIGLALALSEGASDAFVQPAMAGHQWPSDDGSFSMPAWDMVQNNHATDRKLLIIPLQATGYTGGSGLHGYARIKANPFGTSDTDCQAIAIDPGNNAFYFSSKRNTFSTTVVTVDLGTFNVTSGGTFHFECNVGRGGGAVVNVEAA